MCFHVSRCPWFACLFCSWDQGYGQSRRLNQELTEVEYMGEEKPRKPRRPELVIWRALFFSNLKFMVLLSVPRVLMGILSSNSKELKFIDSLFMEGFCKWNLSSQILQHVVFGEDGGWDLARAAVEVCSLGCQIATACQGRFCARRWISVSGRSSVCALLRHSRFCLQQLWLTSTTEAFYILLCVSALLV